MAAARIAGERALLATGFVADAGHEATTYPSAGGSSGSAAVQAVYWRCIAMLFYGARLNNPDLRLVLFSNVVPPVVDGMAIDPLLARLGVEQVRLPLSHRLRHSAGASWGNVFYFLDIVEHLATQEPDARLALLDSDVLVTHPLDTMFSRIAAETVVGYTVDTPADFNVNGMTPAAMQRAAQALAAPAAVDRVRHLGGELVGLDLEAFSPRLAALRALWHAVKAGEPAVAGVRTEEHFWSIFCAAHRIPVADAGDILKRMWTGLQHRTVRAGDEKLPLWHLPAEKRHGLRYLFDWARKRDFDLSIDPRRFAATAGRYCGVPRASLAKIARDGVSQVARRLALG